MAGGGINAAKGIVSRGGKGQSTKNAQTKRQLTIMVNKGYAKKLKDGTLKWTKAGKTKYGYQ